MNLENWVALITCIIAVGGVCLSAVKMIVRPLEKTANALSRMYQEMDHKLDDHEHRLTVVETKIDK